jgi:hypothetical protein
LSAIERATYSQIFFREAFSKAGSFGGRTIDDLAAELRSGELTASDVPIQLINRGPHALILNTRSAQALIRASIPRSAWSVVDMTGDAAAELRLSNQLRHNGLTEAGYPNPYSQGKT